jgi:hypothetical protein
VGIDVMCSGLVRLMLLCTLLTLVGCKAGTPSGQLVWPAGGGNDGGGGMGGGGSGSM